MMEQSPALGFWDKSSEDHLRSRFPVHRACRDGDTGALSVLLAHGEYDLYTEDQFYGWTPAHWSAYHGKLDCLQLLVTAGVKFDVATQRFHQTPAHVAAFGNQPHCLMWLIQSGAGVNAQDYLGESPAHKAARSGGLECLGILKANGAMFRMANNNGHTPKDLAMSCSNEPCALYIQQVAGALHISNGFSSNRDLGRKRGTDDVINGDLKKARMENGMDSQTLLNGGHLDSEHLDGEHLNGTENMELINGTAHVNGPIGQHCPVDEIKGQPNGQDSLTSNGLFAPSIADPTPHANCSNGIPATPILSTRPPRPQDTEPKKLQSSELLSLYTEADLSSRHCQHLSESAMQTEPRLGNGDGETMDLSGAGHHTGVAKQTVPVFLSASSVEHQAAVAMTLGYDKLYTSTYSPVSYCHFF